MRERLFREGGQYNLRRTGGSEYSMSIPLLRLLTPIRPFIAARRQRLLRPRRMGAEGPGPTRLLPRPD
jgi:hypothetical protein